MNGNIGMLDVPRVAGMIEVVEQLRGIHDPIVKAWLCSAGKLRTIESMHPVPEIL